MRHSKAMGVFVALLAAFGLAACGGGSYSSGGTGEGQETASVFTIGTDAPLPAVVSCPVTIMGITLNNGTTNIPVLQSGNTPTVDFAKLSGLHQLVDLQSVPTGTYYSATVTLASANISYIDTTQTPPTVTTIPATLTTMSDTVTFPTPYVVQNADLIGLRMEFDLAKSIQLDANGQVTGSMTPTFNMQLLNSSNAEVSIDDFHATVVSVDSATQFTVQGPKARDWTVQMAPTTVMDDPSVPESSFTTNTIVSLTGTIDPVSHYIDANEVQVVSNDKDYLGGLFTYINPATGPAMTADVFVREELGNAGDIEDGTIADLTLNGSEVYRIGNIALPITTLLFNNSLLRPGQNVDIAGKITTTNGVTAVTVHRIVLRRQGQEGTLAAGTVMISSGNVGSFGLNDNSQAGILLPSPLTVMTTNQTNFIGVSGLSGLTGSVPLRVVGYVLVNSAANTTVLVATSVEELTPNS